MKYIASDECQFFLIFFPHDVCHIIEIDLFVSFHIYEM